MPLRLVAAALASVLYLLGCHWLMTSAPPSPWNVVALLTPMLAALASAAWQAGQRWRFGVAVAAIGVLCALATFGVQVPANGLYLAQHVGINLGLGLWFAGTLRQPGDRALITLLAARVHGVLAPAMVDYTRRLTRLWVAFFFATAAASLLLFASVAFDHWAEFSNLVCPAAIAMLFVGERLLRYRLHPEFERASLADQIRAYTQHSAMRADPRK